MAEHPIQCTGLEELSEVGFKSDGDLYEKNRPGYTDELLCKVAEEVARVDGSRSSDGRLSYNVVELGSGTGKLTELLIQKLPQTFKYLATEKSEEFFNILSGKGLEADVALASADSIPVKDSSVGTVVCAQCFHWFADHQHLKEIHRALVPGGNLIIVMNLPKFDQDWMVRVSDQRKKIFGQIYGQSGASVMDSYTKWEDVFESTDLFRAKEKQLLPGIDYRGTVAKILGYITTVSVYNMITDAQRQACIQELREEILNWPGVDPDDVAMPFSSLLHVYEAV